MKWKDVKIGYKFKDGSIVTQVHRTHLDECAKIIYGDNNEEFICSLNHILLIDISKTSLRCKHYVRKHVSYVPLIEDYDIDVLGNITEEQMQDVDNFLRGNKIDVEVLDISNDKNETYKFMYDEPFIITITTKIIKSEKQEVDKNTFWLPVSGIIYLINRFNAKLFCNDNLIKEIYLMGKLPCFCVSTDSGHYIT